MLEILSTYDPGPWMPFSNRDFHVHLDPRRMMYRPKGKDPVEIRLYCDGLCVAKFREGEGKTEIPSQIACTLDYADHPEVARAFIADVQAAFSASA